MDSGVYIREIEIERGKRGEEKRGGERNMNEPCTEACITKDV